MTTLTRSDTDRLQTEFRGQLISPGDDEYEAARQVWNGAIDRRPALIAPFHTWRAASYSSSPGEISCPRKSLYSRSVSDRVSVVIMILSV